jgi:hypothetical protein
MRIMAISGGCSESHTWLRGAGIAMRVRHSLTELAIAPSLAEG